MGIEALIDEINLFNRLLQIAEGYIPSEYEQGAEIISRVGGKKAGIIGNPSEKQMMDNGSFNPDFKGERNNEAAYLPTAYLNGLAPTRENIAYGLTSRSYSLWDEENIYPLPSSNYGSGELVAFRQNWINNGAEAYNTDGLPDENSNVPTFSDSLKNREFSLLGKIERVLGLNADIESIFGLAAEIENEMNLYAGVENEMNLYAGVENEMNLYAGIENVLKLNASGENYFGLNERDSIDIDEDAFEYLIGLDSGLEEGSVINRLKSLYAEKSMGREYLQLNKAGERQGFSPNSKTVNGTDYKYKNNLYNYENTNPWENNYNRLYDSGNSRLADRGFNIDYSSSASSNVEEVINYLARELESGI